MIYKVQPHKNPMFLNCILYRYKAPIKIDDMKSKPVCIIFIYVTSKVVFQYENKIRLAFRRGEVRSKQIHIEKNKITT